MDDVTAEALPARPSILASVLKRRGHERFSGTLRVDGGEPGTVVMRDGLVIAAATAATPGPEPLLLRSGRVAEADWTEAFTAAAAYGRLSAELVARGLLSTAGVEVVAQTAVVDAIFAMSWCGARTCMADPDVETPPLLPADPGLAADRVVRETARRLSAAAGWDGLGLRVQSRPSPVADREPPADGDRSRILACANGRRTSRDIAFALGRGLFSVLTELAALLEDGLVTLDTPEPVAPTSTPELPRRRRGASGK